MPAVAPQRPRSQPAAVAAALVVVATTVAMTLVALLPTPAHAVERGGPDRVTATSWYGVKLGASLSRVARDHGWTTGDCGLGGTPIYVNVPRHYRVEVAQGRRAGRVGFIEVWNRNISGPHGVRPGITVDSIAGFLSHGARHQVGDGSTDTWTYWVIPLRGHFLYVRSGNDNGSGTRDRVLTFGLADTRSTARSRGETMGGCY